MSIRDNVRQITDDIAGTAIACGRDPSGIVLVAVTKIRSAADVDAVIEAGVAHVGENRVQETAAKQSHVTRDAVWHLIGHLQSNKVRQAAELFTWFDSVDSEKLASKLSRYAGELDVTVDVLIQVNISSEKSKSGVAPEWTQNLAGFVAASENLRLRGLMTIGSLDAEPRETRREFAGMRALFESIRGQGIAGDSFDTLSMGMSGDYRIAVEEGSTMLRIGTALFGARG